jgi:hypothetical protein
MYIVCTSSLIPLCQTLQMKGRVIIQYKCQVPIHVFPKMKQLFPKQNYNVMSPRSYTHISVRDLYISRIGLPILVQGNTVCGQSWEYINRSWTHELWKLCNSQKRETYMYFPYSEGCWEQIQDFFWHWQSVKLNLISRICKLVTNEPKCVKTKKKKQPDDYDDDEIVHDPGNHWLDLKIL